LDEETKKEIEEIKKELNKKENTDLKDKTEIEESQKEFSQKEKDTKENIEKKSEEEPGLKSETPEKIDLLVEELEKEKSAIETEEKTSEIPVSKIKILKEKIFKNWVLIGIFFSLAGIILGLLYLKKIFISENPLFFASPSENRSILKKSEFANKTLNVSEKLSKKIIPYENVIAQYKITLKNFLIPLSEKKFLKVEISLFFNKYSDIEEVVKKEIYYREFFYNYLKKYASSEWLKNENLKKLEEEIKLELKKEKLFPMPVRIIFEGALLKT